MQQWLHRFLDDKRIDLSLGFDEINHPQYMRFPFWIMWNVFSPTATHNEIKQQIEQMNSPKIMHTRTESSVLSYAVTMIQDVKDIQSTLQYR